MGRTAKDVIMRLAEIAGAEWEREGMTFGQDSDGNCWTTSRQGIETTTVTPPPER